ncbi:MAG: lipid A deacylase LpxR family protein [bacterium]
MLSLMSAMAQAEENHWTTNLYVENDLFGETDEQYTSGVRFSLISPNVSSYLDDDRLPGWLRSANDALSLLHSDSRGIHRNLVFSVGQLIFTPEDIEATELIEDDRPYAGYLYLNFAYHMRSNSALDSAGITLGVVGPSAQGQWAQDTIHDLRGLDKFQGWDNQIEDEAAINLTFERKHRYFLKPAFGLEQDLIPHFGLALGNVATYANAGGEYRIGWQLPDDFGTASLRPGGDNSAPGKQDRRLKGEGLHSLHAFISLDARLVARDIFLDGNTFKDSHSVDKKHLVADAAIGLSTTINRWKISYAMVFRSRQFEGQDHGHQYGSLSFSYTW